MLTITMNGKDYSFARLIDGGHWFHKNIIVALSLGQKLSAMARQAGLQEAHNFYKQNPKVEKTSVSSIGKVRRKSKMKKFKKTGVRLKLRRDDS